MRRAGEVIAGLLGRGDRAWVGFEEFHGPDAGMLRVCQRRGFIAPDPLVHPAPTCPHCGDGAPYRLGTRFLCPECRSVLDPRTVGVWPFRTDAFFDWLAAALRLRGDRRQLDTTTWQLGTWANGTGRMECFYHGTGPLSEATRNRLNAYRSVLVITGTRETVGTQHPSGTMLMLSDLLHDGEALGVHDLATLLRPRGNVRFEPHSGVLRVGSTWLGEVPVGSREFHFLDRLAAETDRFVPYEDLKQHVLRHAGSADQTEEATFCQRLKSRIKKKWVARIDALVASSNKGDGYRLRGYAEL